MAADGKLKALSSLSIDRSRPASSGMPGWAWPVFLALVAGGGAGAWYFREYFQAPLEVQTAAVQAMTEGQSKTLLTATGYLKSRWQAAVGAKAAGRIAQIPVEEGKLVKRGDLLAVLEHSDLDAMLESRKVDVERSQAELTEAKKMLILREREYEREQVLFNKKSTTEAALQTTEANCDVARAHVDALAAGVKAASARVREAEEAIRNMHVYAPFDGTVISKDAEQGETIMPGGMGAASGRGSVVTLANLNELEVDTDVKEDYLSQIAKGQPAEVEVDAVKGKRYAAKLREIIPMGDRSRGVVKVKVTILQPDGRLFPELSATVHFLPDEEKQSAGQAAKLVFAPADALVTGDGGQYVWRIRDGQAWKTPVETQGPVNAGRVVVAGDIYGGDVLIVNPPPTLENGAKVKAAQSK